MIYKIVKGNSFLLHIQVQKVSITKDKQMLQDIDISQVSNLHVFLNDMFGEARELKLIPPNPAQATSPTSEIIVLFPSDLEEGIYGITVRGKYNGEDICSIEQKLFTIVHRNAKSHIPLGIVEGDTGGLYCTKYWIELNNFKNEDVDVDIWLDASPSSIAFDGNEHNVMLSWGFRQYGKEVTPSSVKIICGTDVKQIDVDVKSKEVTLSSIGNYQYQLIAVINGKTYNATANISIGSKNLYGSSSVTNPDELDLSNLKGAPTSLAGTEQTITTDVVDDIVWFVSDVPLRFIQSNIEAYFKETIKNGLYYYQSDPLIAGDNTYTIKAR